MAEGGGSCVVRLQWWEVQLKALVAQTLATTAKHMPQQIVGLYKLVWGPGQGVRHAT